MGAKGARILEACRVAWSRLFAACAALLCCSAAALGQDPYVLRVDKSSGLPSNVVYDVLQDRDGFIWLATGQGICRYDGARFWSPGNPVGSEPEGSLLGQDVLGRIWYQTFAGDPRYLGGDSLRPLLAKNLSGFPQFGLDGNRLYFLDGDSIYSLDAWSLDTLETVATRPGKGFSMASSSKGVYALFGTEMLKLGGGPDQRRDWDMPPDFNAEGVMLAPAPAGCYVLSKADPRLLYFGDDGHLAFWQGLAEGHFVQNLSWAGDRLWFCTTSGAFSFDPATGRRSVLYFEGSNISKVAVDRDGKHWFATQGEGVLFVPDFNLRFRALDFCPTRLAMWGGRLLVGTCDDRLMAADSLSGEFRPLFDGGSRHGVHLLRALPEEGLLALVSSRMHLLEPTGRVVWNRLLAVKDVAWLRPGELAFAASGIMGTLGLEAGQEFQMRVYLAHYRGRAVALSASGQSLFLASNMGLVAMPVDSGAAREVLFDGQAIQARGLYRFPDQVLAWTGEQILRVSEDGTSSQTMDMSSGLLSNTQWVKQLGSSLYIVTRDAVLRYHNPTRDLQRILSLDPGSELRDLWAQGDSLYLCFSDGLLFFPGSAPPRLPVPEVLVRGVLSDEGLHPASEPIRLRHGHGPFRVVFDVLSFVPGTHTQTRYRIGGMGWVALPEDARELDISLLPPGRYQVRLQAWVGKTYSQERVLLLEVEPPFWRRGWFVALVALVVAGAVLAGLRLWARAMRRKGRRELERVGLEKRLLLAKLTALKSQMNPHFFFNVLNTLQSLILSSDKKGALRFLSLFSTHVRKILELSDQETVSLSEEAQLLRLYLDIENVRFGGQLRYTIDTRQVDDPESARLPSLLVQPFVENALKHGLMHLEGEKRLLVRFRHEGQRVGVCVDDNGVGRHRSAEIKGHKRGGHRSFATQASLSRLELLRALYGSDFELRVIDKTGPQGQALGTTVQIEYTMTPKENQKDDENESDTDR